MKKTRDYKGRCGNCHSLMSPSDLFCRYCGTPKGEGAFRPYENTLECVYGPPTVTSHSCPSCGHSWTVSGLSVDRAAFCPLCGHGVDTRYEYKDF